MRIKIQVFVNRYDFQCDNTTYNPGNGFDVTFLWVLGPGVPLQTIVIPQKSRDTSDSLQGSPRGSSDCTLRTNSENNDFKRIYVEFKINPLL